MKRHPIAASCPDRAPSLTLKKGESSLASAFEIMQPDVSIALFQRRDRNPLVVRRKSGFVDVLLGLAQGPLNLANPVHLHKFQPITCSAFEVAESAVVRDRRPSARGIYQKCRTFDLQRRK